MHKGLKDYDAVLVLQDGKSFWGKSIGKKGEAVGEVCFTTSMTGYQHTITDPSFAEQIITFAFPHVGNVGINDKDYERQKIFASGIVVREISKAYHSSCKMDLDNWLKQNEIVGISGVDTRALTNHLRRYGHQSGIICSPDRLQSVRKDFSPLEGIDLASKVNKYNDYIVKKGDGNLNYNVALVDFGAKSSIINCLVNLGCKVTVIAAKENFAKEVLSLKPDGIVLSNGPGDPLATAKYAAREIDILIKSNLPIFGICLGHQLLAITLGARTIKMNLGHRGNNHPVYEISSGKVEITTQNHGFVVDPKTLPSSVEVTHISLFDNSVEGIKLKGYQVFSVQYHPEGSPGPYDSHYLFERFVGSMKKLKDSY